LPSQPSLAGPRPLGAAPVPYANVVRQRLDAWPTGLPPERLNAMARMAQGYHFARPLPAAGFEDHVRRARQTVRQR
jgi:hypothetical protein